MLLLVYLERRLEIKPSTKLFNNLKSMKSNKTPFLARSPLKFDNNTPSSPELQDNNKQFHEVDH